VKKDSRFEILMFHFCLILGFLLFAKKIRKLLRFVFCNKKTFFILNFEQFTFLAQTMFYLNIKLFTIFPWLIFISFNILANQYYFFVSLIHHKKTKILSSQTWFTIFKTKKNSILCLNPRTCIVIKKTTKFCVVPLTVQQSEDQTK